MSENGAENGNENGTKRDHCDDENGEDEQAPKKLRTTEKECGTLLFSGLTDYKLRHQKELFNETDDIKWAAHRFKVLEGVRFREVSSGPVAYFTLAISEAGEVYAWGLNVKGQLGMGDNRNRKTPELMEFMKGRKVVGVAVGRQHCLMLTDTGEVYGCGDNGCGQLAMGKKHKQTNIPHKIDDSEMGRVKMVRCGEEFSLFLTERGKVFACGSTENGYLGHGREEKEVANQKNIFHCVYHPNEIQLFIEKGEIGEIIPHGQPTIVHIDAGVSHCCALDDNQRLFTWGFGGLGRLGHNSTANELRPRLMKCWYRTTGRADGGVTRVWCGGQFNIVDTIAEKCKYMFGQFGRNKEANMYPKQMDDLQGWDVRHVACGMTGFTICADDKVIGQMPAPGQGQLAMGVTQKSSARPMLITTLKDLYVLRAGQGYMHSCFIVRDQSEKDQAAIEKFPVMELFDDPNDVEEEVEEEEEEEEPVKKKSKGKTAPKKKTATKSTKGTKASKRK